MRTVSKPITSFQVDALAVPFPTVENVEGGCGWFVEQSVLLDDLEEKWGSLRWQRVDDVVFADLVGGDGQDVELLRHAQLGAVKPAEDQVFVALVLGAVLRLAMIGHVQLDGETGEVVAIFDREHRIGHDEMVTDFEGVELAVECRGFAFNHAPRDEGVSERDFNRSKRETEIEVVHRFFVSSSRKPRHGVDFNVPLGELLFSRLRYLKYLRGGESVALEGGVRKVIEEAGVFERFDSEVVLGVVVAKERKEVFDVEIPIAGAESKYLKASGGEPLNGTGVIKFGASHTRGYRENDGGKKR